MTGGAARVDQGARNARTGSGAGFCASDAREAPVLIPTRRAPSLVNCTSPIPWRKQSRTLDARGRTWNNDDPESEVPSAIDTLHKATTQLPLSDGSTVAQLPRGSTYAVERPLFATPDMSRSESDLWPSTFILRRLGPSQATTYAMWPRSSFAVCFPCHSFVPPPPPPA